MRYDWYSPTVDSSADHVLATLQGGQDLASVYPIRGLYSYPRGAEVRRGDRVLAKVFWGGVNGEDQVHIQASGPDTPQVVQLVREHWPAHRVARADACEDYRGPKVWRQLSKLAIGVAELAGVRMSTVGDWIHARAGRTLYLGGKTSRVQVRVYEKGKQLGVDPDWVRMEVQVRPTGEGKSHLATALPAQLMEVSPWTSMLARRVGIPELDAVRIRDPWTPSDEETAFRWGVRQYGALFVRKAAALGGYAQLGAVIEAELAEIEAQRLRSRH